MAANSSVKAAMNSQWANAAVGALPGSLQCERTEMIGRESQRDVLQPGWEHK